MPAGQWDADKFSCMCLFLVLVVPCLQNLVTTSYIHMYSSTCSLDYSMFKKSMIGMSEATVTIVHVLFIWNIFYIMMDDWIVSGNFFIIFSLRHEEQSFMLYACLKDSQDEVRFLQTCSRVLVFCLLPAKDIQSLSLRIMLAEILTTKGRLIKLISLMWCVQTSVLYTVIIFHITFVQILNILEHICGL